MLFNTNDINHSPIINRTNYEEYFLLYVDDELTDIEKAAVENFIAANPDLQAELDILLSTKLPVEAVSMTGKQSLLSDNMLLNDLDEALLLYMDDELPADQKHIAAEKIKSDKAVQLQYQQLQKAKLDKTETIVFPYKKELYRTTASRRIVYRALQVAAAIIVIAGGTLLLWQQPSGNHPAPSVAQHITPPASQHKANKPAPAISLPEDVVPNIAMQKETENNQQEIKTTLLANEPEKDPASIAHQTNNNSKQNNPLAVFNNIDKIADTPAKPVYATTKPASPIINLHPVTSAIPETYTITDAALHTPDTDEEVADNNDHNKATLKGFLRKATRFIERRTNIDPTDGDGELLIGAVAINLK